MTINEPKDTAKENRALSAAIHAFHRERDGEHAEAVMCVLLRRIEEEGSLLFLGELSESEEEGEFAIPGGIVLDGRTWLGAFTGKNMLKDSRKRYPQGTLLGSDIELFLTIALDSIARSRKAHRTTRGPDGRWHVEDPFPAQGLVIDPATETFYLTQHMLQQLLAGNTELNEADLAVLGNN